MDIIISSRVLYWYRIINQLTVDQIPRSGTLLTGIGGVADLRALCELHVEHLVVDVRRAGFLTRSDHTVRVVADTTAALIHHVAELPDALERLLTVHCLQRRL